MDTVSPISEANASGGEQQFIAALNRGDEAAFVQLVELHQNTMLRLAQLFVSDRVVAEEVVQQAWLGVLQGLARFEGRSSLKTWIYQIVANSAKTRARREGRSLPFSAVWDENQEEPAVEPERFRSESDPYPGHWKSFPSDWSIIPEERLLAQETLSIVRETVEALPPGPREVITLRDIEGWSSEEVCNVLAISETNQRVLLHRARSKVRRALERYMDGI